MGRATYTNWTPEERFLRDLHTHIREIEKEGMCNVELGFHATDRLGVFCWHLEVVEPSLFNDGTVTRVRVIRDFPNGDHTSLAGFLFSQVCKLGVLYDEYRGGKGPTTAPTAH